jgi:glycosyltransferase involved in cell wall biosynthesis
MKGSSCGEDCLITTDNFLAKRHNSTPLITVITVTFNAGEKLERTIQSVINQTLKDVEFIVIDGGSTDKTTDIIRKYENKITYWISEEDQGIFDAMNKGINISSGQWINFMNAGDCFIENETLARISPYLDRTCADIVYGNTVMKYKELYMIGIHEGGAFQFFKLLILILNDMIRVFAKTILPVSLVRKIQISK